MGTKKSRVQNSATKPPESENNPPGVGPNAEKDQKNPNFRTFSDPFWTVLNQSDTRFLFFAPVLLLFKTVQNGSEKVRNFGVFRFLSENQSPPRGSFAPWRGFLSYF